MVSNVHTHSTFCDGANSVEEMAKQAVTLGFFDLGFSSHSPTPFDKTCLGLQDEKAYIQAVEAAGALFKGQLSISCGIEQDYYAPVDASSYDYLIGSVHYLKTSDGRYLSVDNTPEMLLELQQDWYNDNSNRMAEAFFQLSANNVAVNRPKVVGHFDLITKFNKDGRFFKEDSSAYQAIALEAMDAVITKTLQYGGLIEINTGAMSRGYRDIPYPAPFILKHMAERKANVIITSDSHSIKTLNYGFDKALALLQQAGFTSMYQLQNGEFTAVNIV